MGLARKVAPSHRGGAGGKGYRLLGGRSGCSPEAAPQRRGQRWGLAATARTRVLKGEDWTSTAAKWCRSAF